jgi:mRNA-degrading endonuclease HigB of HigAB toxin-antitoxin module
MNTAENTAVAFAEKIYAHMITKMANEALANYENRKQELTKLNAAIAAGEHTWQAPSSLVAEMSFFSGQINAFKAVLAELQNA